MTGHVMDTSQPLTVTGVSDGLASVRLADATIVLPSLGIRSGQVNVSLRPDAVELSRKAEEGAIPGWIAKSAYLGKQVEYTVDSSLGSLFVVESPATRQLPPGESVWLKLRNHGIAIIPSDG
jgi:iron(III) transport system ATP-binding protein